MDAYSTSSRDTLSATAEKKTAIDESDKLLLSYWILSALASYYT